MSIAFCDNGVVFIHTFKRGFFDFNDRSRGSVFSQSTSRDLICYTLVSIVTNSRP